KNSFAEILGPLRWNIFVMFTVDLLHEFELGVFKSVFRHLLHFISKTVGLALSHYYCPISFCDICSFGKGSIQQFPPDVSEMCQHAAWHFKNVLQ
ncbi:hypothetical protein PISMIDRAFT_34736, partial [Pisolithus microcarpus 441]